MNKSIEELKILQMTVEERKKYSEHMDKNYKVFKKELEILLNLLSIDNDLNTPDYLLTEYLFNCLNAYSIIALNRTEKLNTK